MEPRKRAILDALSAFMNQRPGLEPGNYISHGMDNVGRAAYRAEVRSITKDLHHARELMRAVELSDSITADDLLNASTGAFSGRLRIQLHWDVQPDGSESLRKAAVNYCTGQYWPTEYRRAVCAVLASALWTYTREQCSPKGTERERHLQHGSATDLPMRTETQWKLGAKWMSPGDWLRAHFRQQFGRAIAQRWFS
jgi:hypothetical protein